MDLPPSEEICRYVSFDCNAVCCEERSQGSVLGGCKYVTSHGWEAANESHRGEIIFKHCYDVSSGDFKKASLVAAKLGYIDISHIVSVCEKIMNEYAKTKHKLFFTRSPVKVIMMDHRPCITIRESGVTLSFEVMAKRYKDVCGARFIAAYRHSVGNYNFKLIAQHNHFNNYY